MASMETRSSGSFHISRKFANISCLLLPCLAMLHLKQSGVIKNPRRRGTRKRGFFRLEARYLFSDSIPPGLNQLVFVLSRPHVVIIDQLDLINGDGGFGDG